MSETTSVQVLPAANAVHFEGAGKELAQRTMLDTALSRQAQEVQAAMVMAKQFPRDQLAAYNRIMNSCKRPGLAAESQYCYPRGGQDIVGPSIRLAEVLAQNWGNVDFGIVELEQRAGQESIVMAYCWDLETNTRQVKVFTVPHVREKRGGNVMLTDPRDIYEAVANNGARRLRACILGIIPGDVVDDAIQQCNQTLADKDKAEGPLIDRARKLAAAFQSKFQVTGEMLEMRVGKKVDAWTEPHYSTLRRIFIALKDGLAKKEDYFSYEAMQGDKAGPQTAEPKFSDKPAEPVAEKKPRAPRKPAESTEPPKAPENVGNEVPHDRLPGHVKDTPESEWRPETEAPKEREEDKAPGGEEEAPKPPVAAPSDGLPIDRLIQLIKVTAGVSSDEVIRWLFDNRAIKTRVERLGELSNEVINLAIEKWQMVVADIRGE